MKLYYLIIALIHCYANVSNIDSREKSKMWGINMFQLPPQNTIINISQLNERHEMLDLNSQQNTIILYGFINDSIINNTIMINSTMNNCKIHNTIVFHSTIYNSVLNNSSVIITFVRDSELHNSTSIGSELRASYIKESISFDSFSRYIHAIESIIIKTHVRDSSIECSNLCNSTISDSYISNSTITNSTTYRTKLVNVTDFNTQHKEPKEPPLFNKLSELLKKLWMCCVLFVLIVLPALLLAQTRNMHYKPEIIKRKREYKCDIDLSSAVIKKQDDSYGVEQSDKEEFISL
jgi:hypothetical protein